MRLAKPLFIVALILSVLSACAGRPAPEHDLTSAAGTTIGEDRTLPRYLEGADVDHAYLEQLRTKQSLVPAHKSAGYEYDRRRPLDQQQEPSPEAQQAAETVLLLTASAFVCTFVVVVLDGACNFGVHAGYYY